MPTPDCIFAVIEGCKAIAFGSLGDVFVLRRAHETSLGTTEYYSLRCESLLVMKGATPTRHLTREVD